MVFISKNLIRKCKWCDKDRMVNRNNQGRHKGYYTTCGSKECLERRYSDTYICVLKGKSKIRETYSCVVCNENFVQESSNHRKYCRECVPNNAWRSRADRYRIGKKQWDKILEKQNGKCALCDKDPEVVDHCHIKGIVRGLLCQSCNINLKFFDRNEDFIRKVFNYCKDSYV